MKRSNARTADERPLHQVLLAKWKSPRRPSGSARAAGLVAGLGLSCGFIGVVFAIAYESTVSLPGGVLAGDYVTLGRRATESGIFSPVNTVDFDEISGATPEVDWSYGSFFTREGQAVDASGVTHRVGFRRASGNFLSLLGVNAVQGNVGSGGASAAAVISAAMWTEVFASDPDVVGQAVIVEAATPVPIIGVADPAFTGLFESATDFWVLDAKNPAVGQDAVTTVRAGLHMFGVLPEDMMYAALQSLLAGHRFATVGDQRNDRVETVRGLELRPDARRETRQRLVWLAMVVALLLALACTGFVDFLAADHAVREDGLAVRLAIGATPGDVFRESVARHAGYGLWVGGVGLAAFLYLGDVLIGIEPFASALGELGLASSVIGFGAGIALLAVAFLWSCWVAGRAVSRSSLIHGRTIARAARRLRLAWSALLFMAASSLLLCLSIGVRYVSDGMSTLGFAHRDALMVAVWYARGPTPEGSRRIRDALATDAAVRAAARTEMLPLLAETIAPKNRVTAAGQQGTADVVFYRNRVDSAFFEVLGVDLLAGAFLDAGRTQETVLSRTAAMRFQPEIDAVLGMGVELASEDASARGDVFTVVGVVEDIPYGGPEEPSKPVVYTALSETDASARFQDFWLIRHVGNDDDVVGLLHRLGGGIEEAYRIATPAEILSEQFAKRSVDGVLAIAGAFAFALALVGVANALVRAVANQARQVGIRYALGATEADETRRIAAAALTDLVLAGAILCGLVLAGRLVAPALLAVVTLPLVLAALAVVAGVCVLGSYLSVRHLARNAAIAALAGR